jgi:hypothetical protein
MLELIKKQINFDLNHERKEEEEVIREEQIELYKRKTKILEKIKKIHISC